MSDVLLIFLGGTVGGLLGVFVSELFKFWFGKRK